MQAIELPLIKPITLSNGGLLLRMQPQIVESLRYEPLAKIATARRWSEPDVENADLWIWSRHMLDDHLGFDRKAPRSMPEDPIWHIGDAASLGERILEIDVPTPMNCSENLARGRGFLTVTFLPAPEDHQADQEHDAKLEAADGLLFVPPEKKARPDHYKVEQDGGAF